MRISRDQLFMRIAMTVSDRSTCDRGAVGAVIVQDKRVVSMGYNGAPAHMPHCDEVGHLIGETGGCTRATHAEANAVAYAARHGIPCDDGTMYCTYATCATCAALVVAAGIVEFVYLQEYRLSAGLELLRECDVLVRQYDRG